MQNETAVTNELLGLILCLKLDRNNFKKITFQNWKGMKEALNEDVHQKLLSKASQLE